MEHLSVCKSLACMENLVPWPTSWHLLQNKVASQHFPNKKKLFAQGSYHLYNHLPVADQKGLNWDIISWCDKLVFCLVEVRLKRETGKSKMKGRCAEGCALLQTDLISAVRVKVQTTPFCAEVSGVLCWRFSLHINSVPSELSAPHPPTLATHIHLPHCPPHQLLTDGSLSYSCQWKRVFLGQMHTLKSTEVFAACAFACQKQCWGLFYHAWRENRFYRKLKNHI